jgi:hypothetical protein
MEFSTARRLHKECVAKSIMIMITTMLGHVFKALRPPIHRDHIIGLDF